MFAILGSGFGLYGYLPALVEGCSQSIVMAERYRASFQARPELKRYGCNVKWAENEYSALNCANGAVLAIRPVSQSEWIPQCLALSNLESLILEKPLAHSPEVANVVFDALIDSKKVFRIGYTFRYTSWGQDILNALGLKSKSGLLSIHWSFMAHHFNHDVHNWKRFNATGGGAIRFYGIHIIALLAEVGYREVLISRTFARSQNETEKWTAVFVGTGLPECEVYLDSRSTKSKFQVEYRYTTKLKTVTTEFANLSDPFAPQSETCKIGQIDKRVPILSKLCQSLWNRSGNEYEWYATTLNLWHIVEKKTLNTQI